MNIHEYQAKQVLKGFGAPVAEGVAITSADQAEAAAKQLPGPLYVVKSQIHAGGRGKGRFKELGADAKGVVVSQVMPSSLNFGLVREATQLAKARGLDDVSPAMLEGFAAAKVLVEGLRRAAPRITRASLHQALDTLGRYDLGGLALEYTPARHSGLEYADLSIVAANGKFRR